MDKYLTAMIPAISIILLLIIFYPRTGLERILYLPITYCINSCIVFVSLSKFFSERSKQFKRIFWPIVISITVIFAVVTYQQAVGDWVVIKIIADLKELLSRIFW